MKPNHALSKLLVMLALTTAVSSSVRQSPAASEEKPRVDLADVHDETGSVVYVCDASGSMLGKIEKAKELMLTSVMALEPRCAFSVIVFAETKREPIVFFDSLVAATKVKKSLFKNKLAKVETSGSTDPIPAIKAALRMRPESIFLLTDGYFGDSDAEKRIVNEIESLDQAARRQAKISTIIFSGPAQASNDNADLLKKLADDTGGSVAIVSVY